MPPSSPSDPDVTTIDTPDSLTEVVNADYAERLWASRRGLFFKPVAGFGSRAAYRGDKITRRFWQEILAGDYVAQAIVAPGERLIEGKADDDGSAQAMKFNLRDYAYGGEVQWVAARLYQGQTTNFRTSGGGVAPAYSTVDASGRTLCHVDGAPSSYVFLLDEAGGAHAVPPALHVALARHDADARRSDPATGRLVCAPARRRTLDRGQRDLQPGARRRTGPGRVGGCAGRCGLVSRPRRSGYACTCCCSWRTIRPPEFQLFQEITWTSRYSALVVPIARARSR